MATSELATTYAALILADDEQEITAEKIMKLVTAAKVETVEPIWATLLSKVSIYTPLLHCASLIRNCRLLKAKMLKRCS